MGTTAQKLQYLATTKSKIKDVINMTGAGIDANTTFRNYAQALYNGYINVLKDRNTLLDNMNIETSTGSITDSANLPIYEDKMSKLSTQYTTTGKNKLPSDNTTQTINGVVFTHNEDGSITINGKATGGASVYRINTTNNEISLNSGTYVFSTKNNMASGMKIQGWHSSATSFLRLDPSENSKSFTFDSTVSNIRFQIVVDEGNTINNLTIYPMVRLSSVSDSSYEPYTNGPAPNPSYPQEVKTVKGYRNLFDNTEIELGVSWHGNSNENRARFYVPFTANEYYTISVSSIPESVTQIAVVESSSPINTSSSKYSTTISSTFTHQLNSSAEYLVLQFEANTTFTREMANSIKLIITKGSQELPYVPYGTNYVYTTITSGNNSRVITIPLNNNEICGIGDYKDEIVIDKNGNAKITKKIGKKTLNGTENWLGYTYDISGILYCDDIDDYKINENIPLCNYFIGITNSQNATGFYINGNLKIGFGNNLTTPRLYVRYDDEYSASADNFKTWLGTHNTEVYYVLETPTEIDLGNIDMELYEGTNNITNSEDMDMSIRFIKSDFE